LVPIEPGLDDGMNEFVRTNKAIEIKPSLIDWYNFSSSGMVVVELILLFYEVLYPKF